DAPHVDAAADDVGGDEVNDFAVAEALHDAVAQPLIEVTVHDGGPADMLAQVAVEVLRPALALAKDKTLPRFFAFDDAEQQVKFAILVDGDVRLADRLDGGALRHHVNEDRVDHVAVDQAQHRRRDGR